MQHSPPVFLVTGIMAAGKSTVAQLLAERLPRSVHVRGDIFRRMIVRGGTAITPDNDALDDGLRLRYRQAAMVADTYVEAGYVAIVQDIVLGPQLAEYVDFIRTRPLAVVVLAPRPDVVTRREADRPKTGYGDDWTVEELDASLRTQTPQLGLWLDNSDSTPTQTVDAILDRLPEAII